MAQAARKSAIAKPAAKQATRTAENPISTLASKADTTSVRAARPTGLKTGANFTGQYLYDRFVNDKDENKIDVTKMGIVRQMVEVLSVAQFSECVDGMVSIANDAYKAEVEAAKNANKYDSENPTWAIRTAQAQLRTARNHKTVMQNAFGALKFCADELAAKLNGAELGYRMIREIGSKLLADKGIKWDGTKVESDIAKAARNAQQIETAAMLEIQKANPRKEGESRAEYYARIDGEVDKAMEAKREQARIDNLAKLADRVRIMAGEDLPDILEILLKGDDAAKDATKKQVQNPKQAAKVAADKNLH